MNKYARELLLTPMYEEVYTFMTHGNVTTCRGWVRLENESGTQYFNSEADLIKYCQKQLQRRYYRVSEIYGEDIAELICKEDTQ